MYKIDSEKIMFDNGRIFNIIPILDFGSSCDVYRVKIDNEIYAIKLFNGLQRITFEGCKRLQNLNIESYVSPIKLIYINNKFRGYAMKFCNGGNLAYRKLDIPIDEFASSTVKLMEDTEKLSACHYQLYDSYITNGMYDNGFKMIDMDDYNYSPDKPISDISSANMKRLNLFLNLVQFVE